MAAPKIDTSLPIDTTGCQVTPIYNGDLATCKGCAKWCVVAPGDKYMGKRIVMLSICHVPGCDVYDGMRESGYFRQGDST